jgi:NAD(P)-dependent dehydrogenase (short-subunit alcohol dehydrogenase family)
LEGKIEDRGIGHQVCVSFSEDFNALRQRIRMLTDRPRGYRMMGQCQAAVAEAVHAFGRIDILLCCTSQAVIGTVEELAVSDRTQTLVRDQFETNFFGPMNIIKATLSNMREQKIGHMIVLGGITGHLGTPGLGMYCAATWALEGFCDSIAYEIAPFNIKMTVLQASIEIGILLNRIISAPAHPAYSPEATNAPLFRGILDGLLSRLPGIKAQYAASPGQDQYSSSAEVEQQSDPSLLSRNEVVSVYPPLSQAHTEKLLAETVHALTAIGGHENPPARHIVGFEGIASVKEKLKTVSEELEDFVEASNAVDTPRGSHGHSKPEIADGEEDGPVDFGSHDPEDRQSHAG